MKRNPIKKLFTALLMTTALLAAATISASACTTIYVGGNLVEEGTPFVARTEDYGSDMNKMWYISEAGAFQAGDKWIGCPAYGEFEWTFTHDTYRFTYFTNDIYNGACPECGDTTQSHWSYTEFGTNEHGLSVSATETIYGNTAVKAVDPFVTKKVDGVVGIEETDIPTILLAEAASAREGIELLCDIYDNYGCVYASGVFVCDQNEVWYIENCSGHQYVAIKLNDDLVFLEPNIAVIGEVDLDDENVIASDRLIEVAKEAGTFVGNEEENIINFRESYARLTSVGTPRMTDGLKYLDADHVYTADDLLADNTKFTISNIKDGAIVPMYTNISVDRKLTKDDVFNFYKLSSVGKPSNQEIEIFQLFKDRPLETGTVGWVGVGNMSNNVFVPYFPMLIDDIYDAYQVSTEVAYISTEKPDGFCTYGSGYVQNADGSYSRVSGYKVYPENWKDSYYFSFEGLGGYIQYAEQIDGAPVSDSDKAYVLNKLADLQQKIYDDFVTVEELAEAEDPRALATANGMAMAEEAHMLALELVDYITPDVASVGEGEDCVYYKTLTDAINAVDYGGTVKLLRDSGVTATISKKAYFTLDLNGYAFTGTIEAGSDYRCTVTDNTYVITRKSTGSSGSSSSGSSSSGSSSSGSSSSGSSTSTPSAWTNPFVDVKSTAWYYDAVEYTAEKGLLSGVSSNEFAPNTEMTRAMVVQVLYSMAGKPAVSGASPFVDVAENTWYTDAVKWAASKNIVSGVGDDCFAPEVNVTREQLAVILLGYAKAEGMDVSASKTLSYDDATSVSDYAVSAMQWATASGIISGKTGNLLDPQGTATRAEVAQMVMKFDMAKA